MSYHTPINLGVPDFHQHPDLLISVLLAAILDALQAHNCGGYNLTDFFFSDIEWAARHPGVVAPNRCPPYTVITAAMTSQASKAAEELNRVHNLIHGAVEAIKAALIMVLGTILAYDIMDNPVDGFRNESIGNIIAKLKVKFDNPSDATIRQMVAAINIWNPQLTYIENISLFKRRLAFLISKGQISGIGDQVAALYALLSNAGPPYHLILLDFKKLNPGIAWATTATGSTLVPCYTYVDAQINVYPADIPIGATTASLGYGNSLVHGMPPNYPMPHMHASHPAMQNQHPYGPALYGFGLGQALGMPPPYPPFNHGHILNANAAPHVPNADQHQYCFYHGYDSGHTGATCGRMNNRHHTDAMRACKFHRTLDDHNGDERHGSQVNLDSQPWM